MDATATATATETGSAAARIVEAAATLLAGGGLPAVTTRAVAHAAGVQAPTIYRLFGDKDGLLEVVAQQVMASYVADKQAQPSTPHPVDDLRAAWHRHIEFGLANPDLFALLHAHGGRPPLAAAAAGIEVLRGRVHRIAAAGMLCVDEPRAVAMIHAAGTGAVLTTLEVPADRRDHGLADAMLDAVLDAVLTSAPASPPAKAEATALTAQFATSVPDLPGLTGAERTLLTEWLSRSLVSSRHHGSARTDDRPSA
jgi:AcrR family transcriptional regulator